MTWEMLWAVGRYDLRLTDEEFWHMVPRQFDALLRRHREHQMRQEFAEISHKELKRFFGGPRQEASCKKVAESMVKRIVNRLLHCLIKNADTIAEKHGLAEAEKLIEGIVEQAEKMSSEPENDAGML